MLFSNVYNHLVKLSNKMACESTKCYSTAIHTTIIVVLSLQLLGTIEKQVFDFLGYMWAPILGNFFQIICTILGIFGTCQYRPKFIAVYSTWSLIWLGWNIFVICLYLEVGVLNRNKELYILTMGTKSKSWWLDHGIGCRVNNESWVEEVSAETGRPIPPEEFVEGCILAYYYVEVIHAAVQCLLALTGFVFTLLAIYIYAEEPETTTPVNDELEFVKMHTLTQNPTRLQNPTPSRSGTANLAYESDSQSMSTRTTRTTEYHETIPPATLERPPSYETSMRNQQNNVNQYRAADRQSVRSTRSARSARSARSNRSTRSARTKRRREDHNERREELPWVQITPSASNMNHNDSMPYGHFP
ncbi:sodium/potassium-transporting ATPase subunit beta-1-interacting protein-like isoform X3 [Mya arenaria]|uniref:sodium/potassium-transporting ATPase subunit beta-1-interacting protein-like isoform X3 n=1 Tax=Mya arenaria TaxID=6604 RepID=UPI0022E8B2B1|nr:sodium/potassium-transporting ATPase subunit beta-1-interacting protein-like isoform X3 [Mya arenaria]XP_052765014.1 sodium/potassium-transporting ATPase subunit beta-1-interacting protein-like isoform X3 [Mya arenaria]